MTTPAATPSPGEPAPGPPPKAEAGSVGDELPPGGSPVPDASGAAGTVAAPDGIAEEQGTVGHS